MLILCHSGIYKIVFTSCYTRQIVTEIIKREKKNPPMRAGSFMESLME